MPNDIGRGWHLPDDEKLRKMALKKQRTRDNKCAASPDDVERFLLALGYPKGTGIYNTASCYDKYLSTLGKYYTNTVTKDYTMPFNEESQFWWSGKSQVESGVDIFMCVHADVFVSAVPGIFRNVIVALRKLQGRFPVQPISTLSLFDITSLTTSEAHGMIWEMYEDNLRGIKGNHQKLADVIDNQETMCLCHEPSPLCPPPSPPRVAPKKGSLTRPENEGEKSPAKAEAAAPALVIETTKEGGDETKQAGGEPGESKVGAEGIKGEEEGGRSPTDSEKKDVESITPGREGGKGELYDYGKGTKDGAPAKVLEEGQGKEDSMHVDKERREGSAVKLQTVDSELRSSGVGEGIVEQQQKSKSSEGSEESHVSQEEGSSAFSEKSRSGVEERERSLEDKGDDGRVLWDTGGTSRDGGDENGARGGGLQEKGKSDFLQSDDSKESQSPSDEHTASGGGNQKRVTSDSLESDGLHKKEEGGTAEERGTKPEKRKAGKAKDYQKEHMQEKVGDNIGELTEANNVLDNVEMHPEPHKSDEKKKKEKEKKKKKKKEATG